VSPDLAFVLELADLADASSLPRFRALDLTIETKADLTPVTDADRAVERALRERIAATRPGEGVLGEEEGDDATAVRWIVDPIDGTKNFSRGVPVWATLIALERDGELVCSVVSAPALGHRWWAARGEGAFRDGERIGVSGVTRLADASVSVTYPHDLVSLAPAVWHARALGDFWQHVLVAEGSVDAAVDARLAPWDYAALVPIVEEAGGRVSTLDGGGPRPKEQIVTSNGVVHDELLALLARSEASPDG
jgi:histidinol-phosphatase